MLLTDAQWARPEPLPPERTPERGRRWRDHRQVIDAIAFKYRTGTAWTDPPGRFGSWKGGLQLATDLGAHGRQAGVPAITRGADCPPG
ncbi:transposase [Kitasatospora sp. NPDC096077]|uniref:transposase n=1 Tax=Kitasatospora sp. NPDC096077 TaxID=3155544 RepID=UPI00332BB824